MMSARWPVAVFVLLGCLAFDAYAVPFTQLDRRTGVTVTISDKAWVFALEQPHLAAHARDYIAMHAVEINNAGKRQHFLATFVWSTIIGRERFAGAAPALSLRVDDRQLTLKPAAESARSLGISQWPLKIPGRNALLVLYAVDEALLRQLVTARHCDLRPQTDASLPEDVWFEEWQSGRRPWGDFVRFALDGG
jgi:hypothetical protein